MKKIEFSEKYFKDICEYLNVIELIKIGKGPEQIVDILQKLWQERFHPSGWNMNCRFFDNKEMI